MLEEQYQEAKAGLPDPELTENARKVLEKRYLIKDEEENPTETPKDMFWRVARTIAEEDQKYGTSKEGVVALAEEFYRMMAQGRWMPNSPTLTGAGRDLGMLSACFVLPIDDTLTNRDKGIFDTVRDSALVWQAGGGTGYDFSRLRPQGSMVKTTTGVASGPVSFMEIYDKAAETMKQGGHRRAALMGILRCDHPDILEFIDAKQDTSKLTNFNISVAATEEFMRAVQRGEEYELVDPRTQEVVGTLDASEVLDKIIANAHATGEPGLFFIDEANRFNPVPHLGDYEATNPCGEEPLLPYDVCNLGHINLAEFVDDLGADDWKNQINWGGLSYQVSLEMRFLDNVIDANNYPLPEIRDLSDRIRRVGAGVMGWADMLIKLGIPYDSEEALEVASYVSQYLWEERKAKSEELADDRGVFPEWEESVWGPDETCARDEDGNRIRAEHRLRNCKLSTVAPTGTTSIIAGCSGGIEPLYAVAFMRNQAGMNMPDINDEFVHLAKKEGWISEDLMEEVVRAGTVQELSGVPDRIKDLFKTAHDVRPKDHIRMQAAWQENVDAAISKTINFPEDADPEDVREGYELAYELYCKGITVYRDQSREGQALSSGESAEEEVEDEKKGRPTRLRGYTDRQKTPLGRAYVTINEKDGEPFEVFVNIGKAGGSVNAHAEAVGRLISLNLRYGVPMDAIHEELLGISSDRAIGLGPNKVHSLPDGVAKVLGDYIGADNGVEKDLGRTCPDCGAQLSVQEGCESCASCGYSKCG